MRNHQPTHGEGSKKVAGINKKAGFIAEVACKVEQKSAVSGKKELRVKKEQS
jgi:hypothetical protein